MLWRIGAHVGAGAAHGPESKDLVVTASVTAVLVDAMTLAQRQVVWNGGEE